MVNVEIFGADSLHISASMTEEEAKEIGKRIDYAITSKKCMEIREKDGTTIILGYVLLSNLVVKISPEES